MEIAFLFSARHQIASIWPYTLEELNTRLDEAEANIDAGEVLTCEEANAEIRKALP